ncbi:magnesium chelatase subunit H [Pseudoponticoccus marisrubri]|uniref:magnesium chelatase n=1 Tax=Pseudoponticoccus marisrubri TaxID=1685382 RepID=A0A0W7WHK2_9RHOB|nr:magnesium chelatase subunit H [Pseudoponticoccus marisrubri]KUF10034.1 magnesium chelatase [Pseudoponticoccus marisrubri]
MRDEFGMTGPQAGYRVVILTLDSHAAGPCDRAARRLARDFPGLSVTVHAAAEWGEAPDRRDRAIEAIGSADIVIANLLFLEEHITPILPALQARRPHCDAMIGMIADAQIVRLTRMGTLDMSAPTSGTMKLLKKLRGSSKPSTESGAQKMKMLRRLPRILRFIPGKAQDLRAWFLSMQYWLGSSDDNIEGLIRFLLSRYSREANWRGGEAPAPLEYPETGLYHPDLEGRITTDPADLPASQGTQGTVGLLMMRSYVLSSDTAHYDAVIRALEARGLRVLPAFAGGLDGRPAIDAFFRGESGPKIDALLSLTGFSLVGGPAYNDNDAAIETLCGLDLPYVAAHPLEFQTLGQWAASSQGLGPIETTMLIALPELDGATQPSVFGGRHGAGGCQGCAQGCLPQPGTDKAMAPCPERIDRLADKVTARIRQRRADIATRRVAIVLFGFPPNAGAAGTAAYLNVFESLHNTLHEMAAEGYDLTPPETVEELRDAVLGGNAGQYGQEANVAACIDAESIVAGTPHLDEIEAAWGPAPGKVQSDGRGVFVLGRQFGNVFVGLQPGFGYEGDPMRLLFEKGFAPTHAFAQFYLYLRNTVQADVVLHFGMHGALEFMPGKQAGPGPGDWPDRLIGDLPNVYLYAANNPSEATLAKRRSGAVTVTHLTPPLAASGLYKGLAELKDSLTRWRGTAPDAPERAELEALIAEQAEAVDLSGAPETLWLKLLETEDALIPEGLHVVGRPLSDRARTSYLELMGPGETRDRAAEALSREAEMPALLHALAGGFTPPVPGGDLVRNPDILPTGRNIHAFDPFRMPSEFACREGAKQADLLLETHDTLPRSVALVLWGSDNIKSDGSPIGQALALIGARPRFDSFGRLAGGDLIPLSELGRPRIDVIMTLSGIFRDLLPLQTRLLAEVARAAAFAEEPVEQNFVRAHALAHATRTGCTLEEAALRVFSNAEGAYGSNVNQLVDSSAFGDEDELADAYQSRKSYAYGPDGRASARPELLQETLKTVEVAYQNLESVELGVTTVDHYFDTLGGISRAVKRARGTEAAVYISDQTRGAGRIRTLADQVALETRSRALNPRFYEALLDHGAEGVRQIEAHVTNTMGWSATTGTVEPWVYQRLSETFMLDAEMRDRLAALNPVASSRMANRLIEASDRAYWQPDAATLAALQDAADALEDRVEGVAAE